LWYRKRLSERGDDVSGILPEPDRARRPVPVAIVAE
jgi:hypothetical protein